MSHVPVFNNVLNLKHACVCGRLHTVDESLTSSLPALGQAPPSFFFLPGCPFKSHSSFPSSHISCLGFFFFVWWWFLRPPAVRQDTEILSCLLVILVGQKWQKKKKVIEEFHPVLPVISHQFNDRRRALRLSRSFLRHQTFSLKNKRSPKKTKGRSFVVGRGCVPERCVKNTNMDLIRSARCAVLRQLKYYLTLGRTFTRRKKKDETTPGFILA